MSEKFTVVSEPVQGPVMTEEILSAGVMVSQFDDSLGTLIAAEFTFYGFMTSTAFLFDFFPTGFGTVGQGYATSVIEFSSGPGAPVFENTVLELIAFNSTYVFPGGTDTLLLNSTNVTLPSSATDLTGATGDGEYLIQLDMAGSFIGFPNATLPQQSVLVNAEVDYYYVAPGKYIPDQHRFGTSEAEKIKGIEWADTIEAGGGNDTVNGNRGDDLVEAGRGSDYVYGGPGNDKIYAGSGDDRISGNDGNDTLYGHDGDDKIKGKENDDEIRGGAGNDTLQGGSGSDLIWGDDGNDFIDMGSANDAANGGAGNDTLVGGADSDRFYFQPGGGSDRIKDYDPDDDSIYLSDFNTTYAELSFQQSGSHVFVTVQDDVVIQVMNTTIADLPESEFFFVVS